MARTGSYILPCKPLSINQPTTKGTVIAGNNKRRAIKPPSLLLVITCIKPCFEPAHRMPIDNAIKVSAVCNAIDVVYRVTP